jgi:hypothetical protein
MKIRLFTIGLLSAAVGIASCRSAGQGPGPAPEPSSGTGTTAPPNPNPNPLPPEPAPGPTPIASNGSAPSLAAAVPDQPLEPSPATATARPHEEIVKLKRAGASDEDLLNKVRTDGVNYRLTTGDVVELKAAGLSEAILEAMLRSGQSAPTR